MLLMAGATVMGFDGIEGRHLRNGGMGLMLLLASIYALCGLAFIVATVVMRKRAGFPPVWIVILVSGGLLMSIGTANYVKHHAMSAAEMVQEDLRKLDTAIEASPAGK